MRLFSTFFFLLSSLSLAAATDTSPDTIAKYLAGLAVPAASADSTTTEYRAPAPEPAATPSPISHPSTFNPQPFRPPRPGSLIPDHVYNPSPTDRGLPRPDSKPLSTPQPSSFNPQRSGNPWATHSAELDHAWKHTEEKQLSAIASWAPENLGRAYQSTETMFYMFSGPDFLYAHAFFPDARSYILVGNEPVGSLPDLDKISPNELPIALANIRKSLESVLNWSFFITKDMKTDLTQPQLGGTLPLLYVFLSRANCTIDSVTPVTVDNNGNLTDGGPENVKGVTSGVRIVFHSTSQPLNLSTQTLYYFATDLSDDGIKATPGLMKFCEQQGKGVSLLKAASYLMHEPGFSRVRQFLLDHSDTIVEDDSGIPFRYFQEQSQAPAWNIQLHGPYVGPIDIFKKYYQPDLASEFSHTPGAPLPFGFGYQWAPLKSNLMVAQRR